MRTYLAGEAMAVLSKYYFKRSFLSILCTHKVYYPNFVLQRRTLYWENILSTICEVNYYDLTIDYLLWLRERLLRIQITDIAYQLIIRNIIGILYFICLL